MYRIRLAGLLDWLESVVFPKCCWYLELFIPFICLIHYFLFLLPRSLFFSLLKTTHQYALHFVFLWENIYVIFLLGQYVYKPPWYYFILPLSLSLPIFTCRHAIRYPFHPTYIFILFWFLPLISYRIINSPFLFDVWRSISWKI